MSAEKEDIIVGWRKTRKKRRAYSMADDTHLHDRGLGALGGMGEGGSDWVGLQGALAGTFFDKEKKGEGKGSGGGPL